MCRTPPNTPSSAFLVNNTEHRMWSQGRVMLIDRCAYKSMNENGIKCVV